MLKPDLLAAELIAADSWSILQLIDGPQAHFHKLCRVFQIAFQSCCDEVLGDVGLSHMHGLYDVTPDTFLDARVCQKHRTRWQ